MLTGLFDSTNIPLLEQVVNFAQSRHNVLAGNVANLDTPGYKTRDFSVEAFQGRLKAALEAGPAGTHGLSGASSARSDALEEAGEDLRSILYHDLSDVSLERQLAEIAKNQALHNQAMAIMSHQFRLLRSAISERAV